ncbi:MAG: hypothetical protein KIT25_05205 [Enhydrobacter sp.]|nr:MAG: hypothetical protein KIT25_05205 [Enhydrobacter sp.]
MSTAPLLTVLLLAACQPEAAPPAAGSVSLAAAAPPAGRLPNDVALRPARGTWTAEFAGRLLRLWNVEQERTNSFEHRWDWIANPVLPDTAWQPDLDYPPHQELYRQPLSEICRKLDRDDDDSVFWNCDSKMLARLEHSLYRYTLGDRADAASTAQWFLADFGRVEAFASSAKACKQAFDFNCVRVLRDLPLLFAIVGRPAEARRALALLDVWNSRGQTQQDYDQRRAEAISAVVGGLYVMGQLDDLFAFARLMPSEPLVRDGVARALNAGIARSNDLAGKRALLAAFAAVRRSLDGGSLEQASLQLALDCNTAHVALDGGDEAAARSAFAGLVSRYERMEADVVGEAGFCLWRLAPRVQAQAEQGRIVAAMEARRETNAKAVEAAVAGNFERVRQADIENSQKLLGPLTMHHHQDQVTRAYVGMPLRYALDPRPIGPLLVRPEAFEEHLVGALELTKEVPKDRTQYYGLLAVLALERHIYFGD